MRIAHFDCFSGISGDMVLGALLDAGIPVESIRSALDSLQLPIQLEVERVKRCGFAATKATIQAQDQEDYRFLPDIEAILAKSSLAPRQLALARTIQGKYQEGIELAKVALNATPRSDQAVSFLLQAAARSGWQGDPEALIPAGASGVAAPVRHLTPLPPPLPPPRPQEAGGESPPAEPGGPLE